ncbi:hypothetical protein BD410DRAFT_73598 [Rickenella mellea]|uniref:Arrestin-like N-terminal domain-containing protein n=1 Tax=Rickenella mellea TaxID=50990 RepID=A0A4Y7QBG3_9AGAM|nr:hypothetical protein BD410DRAFT_73598 [Rickenella mellea]
MPVQLEILPLSSNVDMYGEPETSTAYSLAGQVSVTLSSSMSFFERPKAVKIRLQSLSITFEGQSELVEPDAGYVGLRLCEITNELAPSESLELSNEGHEEGKPCTWNFVFDLPIPGWLPASSIYGSDAYGPTGTRYALFATAKFVSVDDGHKRTWSLANLCLPFSSRTKVIQATKHEITVNRFKLPPGPLPSAASLFPVTPYAVKAHVHQHNDTSNDSSRISPDILSKIDVLASVPESLSLDEACVPFTLRLRADGLEEEHQKRLRLTDFYVDVNQLEKYSTSPSEAYSASFPLPPALSQPPVKELRNAHEMKALYEMCLIGPARPFQTTRHTFSIVPSDHSGHYTLANGGLNFVTDDTPEVNARTWLKMDVNIPIEHVQPGVDRDWEAKHGRVKAHRATEVGPLLSVRHEMQVVLACAYDRAEESLEPLTEHLTFVLPLHFVAVPPTLPTPAHSRAPSAASLRCPPSPTPSSSCSSASHAMPPVLPYAVLLPAYSQLFHPNGDRKIDYSVPLPVYTPKGSTPSIETSSTAGSQIEKDLDGDESLETHGAVS